MSWLLLIGICIGLILMGIGAFIGFKKLPFNQVTSAEVTSVECTDGKCYVEVKFVDINQKTYIKKARLPAPVEKGDDITIIYDSSNPNNFYPGNPPVKLVGSLIGIVGLFILIATMSIWLFGGRSSPETRTTESMPFGKPEPISLPPPKFEPQANSKTDTKTSATKDMFFDEPESMSSLANNKTDTLSTMQTSDTKTSTDTPLIKTIDETAPAQKVL